MYSNECNQIIKSSRCTNPFNKGKYLIRWGTLTMFNFEMSVELVHFDKRFLSRKPSNPIKSVFTTLYVRHAREHISKFNFSHLYSMKIYSFVVGGHACINYIYLCELDETVKNLEQKKWYKK